jgi:hypothetical protein
MAKPVSEHLACPCGHTFEVTAADGLHVTDDPDLRAAIVGGDVRVYPCPSCGARVQLDALTGYTDLERGHWFVVFPESALADWRGAVAFADDSFRSVIEVRSAPIVKTWAPRLRRGLRAVFGLDALRDKLLALDAGLDDRLVEQVKLDVVRWLELSPTGVVRFERIEDDQLVFAWVHGRGPAAVPAQPLPVPLDVYQRLVTGADGERPRAPELFDTIAVDYRVALDAC